MTGGVPQSVSDRSGVGQVAKSNMLVIDHLWMESKRSLMAGNRAVLLKSGEEGEGREEKKIGRATFVGLKFLRAWA